MGKPKGVTVTISTIMAHRRLSDTLLGFAIIVDFYHQYLWQHDRISDGRTIHWQILKNDRVRVFNLTMAGLLAISLLPVIPSI